LVRNRFEAEAMVIRDVLPRRWAAAATLAAVVALGACGSTRFGGGMPVASAPATPVYNEPELLEPTPTAPSGQIVAEPLPPPGASGNVAGLPGGQPGAGSGGGLQVAVATPGRASVVGAWTARDASGSTCRVQLSSAPALDLYKASAAGCGNRDLGRITAWDYRDGEVYLYQPGGAVAARLRPSGGSMDGVLAKSGAPLTLTR
jgi:hypothetical protein